MNTHLSFRCAALLLTVGLVQVIGCGQKDCIVSYDPKGTTLQWTAYKFTEKAGVSGTFEDVQVVSQTGKSVLETASTVKFTIDSSSVNSGNPERDGKIKQHFFGTMKDGGRISGRFEKSSGGGTDTAQLILSINGVEKSIPVKYSVKKGPSVEVTGTLDMNDWGAQDSLKAINTQCEALHKGKDGKSRLWPTFDFKVESTFREECRP